jgi:Domain of unknown function (DUF4406)
MQDKVYIAGPMESVGGNWNVPLFNFVAKKLREQGCEVFSPVELTLDTLGSLDAILKMDKDARKKARKECLKIELSWICDHATRVLMLPGWERSPGAKAEHALAIAIGVEVHEADNIILPAYERDELDQTAVVE